jgi:hypothetical protein
MVARAVDPRKLVFVDEMGTNTSLSALYAYSLKGRRAYAQVPRNRGANTTLLASMSLEGVGLCLAISGIVPGVYSFVPHPMGGKLFPDKGRVVSTALLAGALRVGEV